MYIVYIFWVRVYNICIIYSIVVLQYLHKQYLHKLSINIFCKLALVKINKKLCIRCIENKLQFSAINLSTELKNVGEKIREGSRWGSNSFASCCKKKVWTSNIIFCNYLILLKSIQFNDIHKLVWFFIKMIKMPFNTRKIHYVILTAFRYIYCRVPYWLMF